MTSLRRRKAAVCLAIFQRKVQCSLEDRLWDQMPEAGREFGSPDFERLMDEDYRNRVGVFDPALVASLLAKRRRRP